MRQTIELIQIKATAARKNIAGFSLRGVKVPEGVANDGVRVLCDPEGLVQVCRLVGDNSVAAALCRPAPGELDQLRGQRFLKCCPFDVNYRKMLHYVRD